MATITLISFLCALIALSIARPPSKAALSTARSSTYPKLNTTLRQRVRCGRGCDFEFCDDVVDLFSGIPDVPISDAICKRNGDTVGFIRSTGEAIVSPRGMRRSLIGNFDPPGLNTGYPEDFFGVYTVTEFNDRSSGVGHRPFVGNQNAFLDGMCVRLPITSYEIGTGRGFTTVTTSSRRDCIAFLTEVPRITVELEWNTGDDLDLAVFEPDGDRLDTEFRETEAGIFVDDVTDQCGFFNLLRRERAVYTVDDPVENGVYRAEALHFLNCGDGPTTWKLAVYINGILSDIRQGVSNSDDGAFIIDLTFTL